jgi:hypothetical protein
MNCKYLGIVDCRGRWVSGAKGKMGFRGKVDTVNYISHLIIAARSINTILSRNEQKAMIKKVKSKD